MSATTKDNDEIARFSAQAKNWWDKTGSFKPLHKLNPLRIQYLTKQISQHFNCPDTKLEQLNILDIGCGGGLIAEPLARLGAIVTAIDASKENIEVAKNHAKISKLDINYLTSTAEEMAEKKQRYDVVTALEVIEHVSDMPLFIKSCTKLVKPNGLLILSTLNRTAQSYALGIIAAEYIFRWVPKNTHDWKKFIKPSELVRILQDNAMSPCDLSGIRYNPISDYFSLSHNVKVNYLLTAKKDI